MKILVTGGAGYIGSFMTKALVERGNEVVVFDSLERGHKESIDNRAKFFHGDLKNIEDLGKVFKSTTFDAIIHFAGLISVEESTKNPEIYEENNVTGSSNLFNIALAAGVSRFIFSSTAAVYGNPVKVPIPEDHPKNPESKYGETKLKTEENLSLLKTKNSKISFAALRYFNAAGAALDGSMGESHMPETHIIPLAIKAALKREPFSLFGRDYSTPDGTCMRDYIHVLDLVQGHLLALDKIIGEEGAYFYNVGTGVGHSNKEVIEMVEKISEKKIDVITKERRGGDADQLIADASKIKQELGFSPKYSDLTTIVKTAWLWHNK